MDQNGPNRSETEALAAQSAAAVRALRDRAQRALDERQPRLAELEQRIAAQLELVTEELAHDAVSAPSPVSNVELEALDDLRRELDRERNDWECLRQQQTADLVVARQHVDQISNDLSAESAALAARTAELEAQAEEFARQHAKLASDRSDIEQQCRKLEAERAELEVAVSHYKSEQESTAQADHEELDHLQRELEHERSSWQSERQQLETRLRELTTQNAELRSELAEAERRLAALQQSVKSDVAVVRNELAAQTAAWQRERAKLSAERGEISDELQSVRSQLEHSLEQEAIASAGLVEVVPKFELAMEDARRLRGRVAELEQELARRPQGDQHELPELIHLRAERDSLVDQVASLEGRLTNETNADGDQELADLRRRFEMAVEDVRQLKTEKAKLEQDLATVRRSPGAIADVVASDWEAQKRRMLATLEGDEPTTPERKRERASIEGTIRITDEVVAEKDREIETLRQQLDDAAGRTSDERIIDADELIRTERERLVALEAELHEKLRAAEMELSMARAKLTRQDSELEKQRHELETLKKAGPSLAASGSKIQEPKRRWLDKLGLGGDQER